MASKKIVVLDANVLYGNFLRNLLLSLFASQMYEAKWTEQITKEWVGHLLKNRETVTESANQRTVTLMNAIRPDPLVTNYEKYIGDITIPDVDDRHVVAAAIACSAQKIVTWNLADFPNKILKVFGVHAESPDKFIFDLISESPDDVVRIFREMRLKLKAPPVNVEEFFRKLNKERLFQTAKALKRYYDLL